MAAHSIYFLVLAEYGFLGAALLLFLLYRNIRQILWFQGSAASATDPPLSEWYFTCMNMSVIGYAVCGAFLGGVNYPHLHHLTALTLRGEAEMTSEAETDSEVIGTPVEAEA